VTGSGSVTTRLPDARKDLEPTQITRPPPSVRRCRSAPGDALGRENWWHEPAADQYECSARPVSQGIVRVNEDEIKEELERRRPLLADGNTRLRIDDRRRPKAR
jgi:hypothetical protein